MAGKTEMIISLDVGYGDAECETYTPANGVEFNIIAFHGEAAFDPNAAVELVWDSDGTPEILWTIKGSGQCPISFTRTGDGTKKLALCLDNGMASGSVYMSGYALVVEY